MYIVFIPKTSDFKQYAERHSSDPALSRLHPVRILFCFMGRCWHCRLDGHQMLVFSTPMGVRGSSSLSLGNSSHVRPVPLAKEALCGKEVYVGGRSHTRGTSTSTVFSTSSLLDGAGFALQPSMRVLAGQPIFSVLLRFSNSLRWELRARWYASREPRQLTQSLTLRYMHPRR